MMTKGPLSNIRVLDMSRILAGSSARARATIRGNSARRS
jgi:crotonobetainyl-CoA:carnitine CoA-transferase CaiB-like acyl-CoA transferase